jgi:hypothetical protein
VNSFSRIGSTTPSRPRTFQSPSKSSNSSKCLAVTRSPPTILLCVAFSASCRRKDPTPFSLPLHKSFFSSFLFLSPDPLRRETRRFALLDHRQRCLDHFLWRRQLLQLVEKPLWRWQRTSSMPSVHYMTLVGATSAFSAERFARNLIRNPCFFSCFSALFRPVCF